MAIHALSVANVVILTVRLHLRGRASSLDALVDDLD